MTNSTTLETPVVLVQGADMFLGRASGLGILASCTCDKFASCTARVHYSRTFPGLAHMFNTCLEKMAGWDAKLEVGHDKIAFLTLLVHFWCCGEIH